MMLKEENKIQVSKSSSQLLWSSWKRCNAHMNWKSQFGEFSMGLTNVNSISSTTIICFYFYGLCKGQLAKSLSFYGAFILKVFFI
jgi:hypothetical protein